MNLKFLSLIFFTLLLSSCALKPLKTEYDLQSSISEPILIDKLGKGKVLIYNGAGYLNKIDNTASVNIWINNKALGQLKVNQYAVLYLLPGRYEFKIQHVDVTKFENIQTVDIDFDTKIIRVKPTITSNKVTIEDDVPSNFHKYKNITR